MKKLIEIEGELKDKGSPANLLAIKAAKKGIDLKAYIKEVLTKHAKK